jgi:hypothetical protein
MKLHLFTNQRTAATLAWGTMFAASLLCVNAQASEWDKKTLLTVNQPIQIRETLLQPGQYVLKLLDSSSDRHIVQIFNRDQSQIINTVLAIPRQRRDAASDTQFMFWETPPGTAKALRAWFYPGDNVGNEFPYPKQLQQLALLTPPAATASEASETTSTPTTMMEPPAQAEPLSAEPAPPQPTTTVEQDMAPAPPPQAPVAPPVLDDNSADRAAPAELPKTASPYPLIGLCGLALAGLGGMLRIKRLA